MATAAAHGACLLHFVHLDRIKQLFQSRSPFSTYPRDRIKRTASYSDRLNPPLCVTLLHSSERMWVLQATAVTLACSSPQLQPVHTRPLRCVLQRNIFLVAILIIALCR